MEKEIIDIDESIEELHLSHRVNNALRRIDLVTISDVIYLANTKGLGSIRNLGDKSILEIEQTILEKCNVAISKDGYSELKILNLSKRALNMLIHKYSVVKLDDVLDLCVNKNNSKNYLDSNVKSEKEIIDRVHELGYFFSDEREEIFSLDDDISKLNFSSFINSSLYRYGVRKIKDLLSLSLDKNANGKEKGIYRVRGFGDKKVQELVDLIHSMGFVFDCERSFDKNEKFLNEYDNSDSSYEVYNFFYDTDKFNECIFRVSKDLNNGLRNYQFYFDDEMKERFLDNFYNEFNICDINFEMFVLNEFNNLLYNLRREVKNIIEGSGSKMFQNYLDLYHDSVPLFDKIFSKFKNILNEKYIRAYVFNTMDYRKKRFRNNKKFKKLIYLFDRILLFIEYEEKELISEKDNASLEKLNKVRDRIIKEKVDIYYYIIDYYFDKNLTDNSINDYAIGNVNKIVYELQKEYKERENIFGDLELLFGIIPEELVDKEFYNKISINDDIVDSKFVINFIKLVNQVCCKENGDKYSTKEIILFLQDKFYNYNDDIPKDKNKMVNGIYKLSRHL